MTDLKTELETNPVYAAALAKGDHIALAVLLSADSDQTTPRDSIPAQEVGEAIDLAEHKALSEIEQLIVAQYVNPTRTLTAKMVALLANAFPDGKTTSALASLQTRPMTEAEKILGVGKVATVEIIGKALEKPVQVQDEKFVMVDGQPFIQTMDDQTRYAIDTDGNVLRDDPIATDLPLPAVKESAK